MNWRQATAAVLAAVLLSASCAACSRGSTSRDPDGVKKEDCSAVYGEIIAVNGDHLTVDAAEEVLSLTVRTELLIDWKEGDEVILYYTGPFGADMTVRYLDRWTENSEVQRPADKDKGTDKDSGGVIA